MEAYTKWAQKPETKAKLAAAKQSTWADFTKQFPNADKTKFVAQTDIDNKWKITVEIFFKEGPHSLQSVFGSDRKYWSQQMKTALGLAGVGGFPYQLSPQKKQKRRCQYRRLISLNQRQVSRKYSTTGQKFT